MCFKAVPSGYGLYGKLSSFAKIARVGFVQRLLCRGMAYGTGDSRN